MILNVIETSSDVILLLVSVISTLRDGEGGL